MAHDTYTLLMNLVLDRQATDREEADLQLHMRGCAACTMMYEDLQRMDAMFKVQPEVRPSLSFTSNVMAKVARYETSRRWYPWFVCVMLVIVAAALVSTLLPFAIVWFGLYRPLFTVPVIGPFLSLVGTTFTAIASMLSLLLGDLMRWLNYLLTQPAPLAVVVSALMLASIWIGMLEVSKSTVLAEAVRQKA
jgi:predicted anti-sigma-YlaC factor YlaD